MTSDGGDDPQGRGSAASARLDSWADPIALAVLAPGDDALDAFADAHGFDVVFDGEPTDGDGARIGDVRAAAVVLVPDGPSESIQGILDAIRERTTCPVVLYTDDVDPDAVAAFLASDGTDYVHRRPGESDVVLANRIRSLATHTQLTESHDLVERALDQAAVGITIADANAPDMPLIYANEGFSRLTGYPVEAAIGRNCRFLQGPDTDQETVDRIRAAIDAEEPIAVELTNYTPEGERFWNHLSLSPVFDADGDLTHYFGFQRDVTERKQLAAELRAQNERLETFASVLSHDLRNPLAIAQGHLEEIDVPSSTDAAAVDDDLGPELEAIDEALNRMDVLITDVLALARDGQTVDATRPVSLADVAQYAWSMVDTDAMTLEVDDADAVVSADRDRLVSVFENLYRNAVEHAIGASTVRVAATAEGFTVEDDGPGVPAAKRDAIFERGVSGSEDGTGFGLAIVEAIAGAHGWTVEVTESDDGGAAFVFSAVDVSLPDR